MLGRSFVVALVLVVASCSTGKQLEAHRAELLAATAPGTSLAAKRDALGTSVVAMMHQAVDRLDPRRGAAYVRAYAKTNGPLVDTLAAQIGRATSAMTTGERIAFGLRAASAPYARDAVQIVPRFVERYRRLAAASRIVDGLKASLLGGAGDLLPGIGDTEIPIERSASRPTYSRREGRRHPPVCSTGFAAYAAVRREVPTARRRESANG